MRSAIMGVEPVLIRIVVVNNGKGGGKARTRQPGSRISRSITSWLALTLGASGRMCQMRSAPRGLRRISDRNELASAAVGGAKHVHTKRVGEFCDG
jgi:hypothetical protein